MGSRKEWNAVSKSEQLRASLQRLTEEQQQVLTLKFIAGLSTAEIAAQMGKRQGAVRALQMRALQALAMELGLEELEMEFEYEKI